jgi:hypothetical protein
VLAGIRVWIQFGADFQDFVFQLSNGFMEVVSLL